MDSAVRRPLVGNVPVGQGKYKRADASEGKWAEMRTHPSGWSMTKPQLHESRGGRPLIVLIPWAGATPQQMSDVVYYWQDQGCSVLRLTPHYWSMFSPAQGKYGAQIRLFYDHLRTHVMPSKGFVIHAMSSLGSYTVARLIAMDSQGNRNIFDCCRGIIFDCGPFLQFPEQMRQEGFLNVEQLSESAGIITAASTGQPLAPVVSLVWTPVYLLLLIFIRLFYATQRLEEAEQNFVALTEGVKDIRVHLIFSEADDYCLAADVLAYKEIIAHTTKVKVTKTDTEHVRQLQDAPDETRKALSEFLVKCENDY
eukprot:TRINITY_DN33303_c0_g1_i1.p1 TRINITY_DN33303_c0_g1~~TRINITY_DN33303_c0_g1_i1.p1  ORF type:complete len:310 (+),score=109.33 TRINITY_DN33303_c0_g1_i1:44-973(+)